MTIWFNLTWSPWGLKQTHLLYFGSVNWKTFKTLEAAHQKCSYKNLFWKYDANLQENTHDEVGFQDVISKKLLWNFIEITLRHGFFSVNFAAYLQDTFT